MRGGMRYGAGAVKMGAVYLLSNINAFSRLIMDVFHSNSTPNPTNFAFRVDSLP